MNATQLFNGTHSTLTASGTKIGEAKSFQAKVTYTKKDIAVAGKLMVDSFVESAKGTGSMELYRISSRFIKEYAEATLNGEVIPVTLVSAIENKVTKKQERIQLTGVSFDEVSLADWSLQTEGTMTIPFTFTDFNLLDEVKS